jgi:GT2 family glycosyltransferase
MAEEVSADLAPTQPPLVSVIIPVYNRLQYLEQAIRSAMCQTHPAIEVVVVDDGSPLDPGPIVAPFRDRVLFLRKPNGGLASARNFGIAAASGAYLSFLDDDDFLQPEAIETLFAALGKCPGARWAAGRFFYVDEAGQRCAKKHHCRFESGDIYPQMIRENLMGAPSTVLIETELVRSLGCFDVNRRQHRLGEDYDLWLAAAKASPVAAVPAQVTNYRVHPQQISTTSAAKLALALIEVLEKHRALAAPSDVAEFDRSIAQEYLGLGDFYYVTDQIGQAQEAWRNALTADPRRAGWPMHMRFCKSRLPRSVVALGRGLRGWAHSWRRYQKAAEETPSPMVSSRSA